MTKLISLKATVNSIDSFPCLGVVLVGQVRVVPLVGKSALLTCASCGITSFDVNFVFPVELQQKGNAFPFAESYS